MGTRTDAAGPKNSDFSRLDIRHLVVLEGLIWQKHVSTSPLLSVPSGVDGVCMTALILQRWSPGETPHIPDLGHDWFASI